MPLLLTHMRVLVSLLFASYLLRTIHLKLDSRLILSMLRVFACTRSRGFYISFFHKFAGDALIVLWPPPAREALTDITKKGREKESGEVRLFLHVCEGPFSWYCTTLHRHPHGLHPYVLRRDVSE